MTVCRLKDTKETFVLLCMPVCSVVRAQDVGGSSPPDDEASGHVRRV